MTDNRPIDRPEDRLTKVEAPNRNFSGVGVAGLVFANGTAFTDNRAVIDYCLRHGYKVTGPGAPEHKPATLEQDPQTLRTTPTATGRLPEDAGASRAMTDEQRRAAYGAGVGQLLDDGKTATGAPQIAPSRVAYANATARGEQPEFVADTPPGGTEQIGLTREQADHAAAVRMGLAAPGRPRASRPEKSSSPKSTRRSRSTKKADTKKAESKTDEGSSS